MKNQVLPYPKRNPEAEEDLKLLRELMPSLSENGTLAIYFRFWERLLIEEIASILGLSWDEADHLIENSIKELRGGFSAKQLRPQQKAA